MESPMLSLQSNSSTGHVTPHLLPCRLHHDGPVGATDPYWTPFQTPDGKRVAHFRGRELHGKALRVPDGYRGVLVVKTDAPPKCEARARRLDGRPAEEQGVEREAAEEEGEEKEEEVPLGSLETQAQFDEMVVWGHEAVAEAASDPYARGVEEWVQLSAQIHSYDMEKA